MKPASENVVENPLFFRYFAGSRCSSQEAHLTAAHLVSARLFLRFTPENRFNKHKNYRHIEKTLCVLDVDALLRESFLIESGLSIMKSSFTALSEARPALHAVLQLEEKIQGLIVPLTLCSYC